MREVRARRWCLPDSGASSSPSWSASNSVLALHTGRACRLAPLPAAGAAAPGGGGRYRWGTRLRLAGGAGRLVWGDCTASSGTGVSGAVCPALTCWALWSPPWESQKRSPQSGVGLGLFPRAGRGLTMSCGDVSCEQLHAVGTSGAGNSLGSPGRVWPQSSACNCTPCADTAQRFTTWS